MATTDRVVGLNQKNVGQAGARGRNGARANFARVIGVLSAVLLYGAVATPAHAAPGDLDPTFGTAGKVTTDFGSNDGASAIAIQPDGKIVAAGGSGAFGSGNFVLSRYNVDGSLDSSFGTGGKVTTSFPGASSATAIAIAIQADGKIVAVGATPDGPFDFALARYNADGSLDGSFGTGGRVTTDFGKREVAMGVKIQADGKIVAAGFACSPFANDAGNCDIALARYNADGSLDSSFGSGGKVMTGPDRLAQAVAIQADGKIVTAGGTFIGGSSDFLVARFNSDGSLDSTFGSGGLVATDFAGGDGATSIAIQTDGKIVAGGGTGTGDFGLVRYNSDGSLDLSFDGDGKVTTDFAGGGQQIDSALAVAIQPDGKIVAVGVAFAGGGNPADFALARYNADGSLDAGFGSGGKVATDFASTGDVARAVAIQADGKIVAAGERSFGFPAGDFALTRYLGGVADAVAPTTSASAAPPPNAAGWNNGNVTVTLSATDNAGGSGVQSISFTVANGATTTGSSATGTSTSFTVSAEGVNTISYHAVDNAGNVEATKTLVVRIDKTPPSASLTVSPSVLWPPNHKLVSVTPTLNASDPGGGPVTVSGPVVTSSEPVTGRGDKTSPDWVVNGNLVQLRAERNTRGPSRTTGRVYTLTYVVTDQAGNSTTASATVTVPHNLKHDKRKGRDRDDDHDDRDDHDEHDD